MRAWDFSTPIGRWASFGPYYAMFPVDFAKGVIEKHTAEGDLVIDPFAGRGTTPFAAGALGRRSLSVEINPVGWLFGYVKTRPASAGRVLARLDEVGEVMHDTRLSQSSEFFRLCFAPEVRRFLETCRRELAWRTSRVDATLMAMILVYLHGKEDSALSNQMRQGKAMAPDYSVNWWKRHGMLPPVLDPIEFIRRRIEWRYEHGSPSLGQVEVVLGDCRRVLARKKDVGRAKLLLTSPPYQGVTNYHYDQWLRLWMLGGPARPPSGLGDCKGRFSNEGTYGQFLVDAFESCVRHLSRTCIVYVRTDARQFTRAATTNALKEVFPRKRITSIRRPVHRATQTALYGDTAPKPGEVDIILR